MKKVVRISIIAAIVFSLAGISVDAQPGYGHKHGAGHGYGYPDSCRIQLMVDDMKQALDLSDKQVGEIEQIHYAHMQEVKELQGKYKDDCVGEREARRAMRDKVHEETKAVLNEEQQVKFDEFITDRKGPHGHRKGKGKK